MSDIFSQRLSLFCGRLKQASIDVALITDEDSIYYLCGYYDYLHMDFGRPTILVIKEDGGTLLVTPNIDLAAAKQHARVDQIAPWNDGMGLEWRQELHSMFTKSMLVAIEVDLVPPVVQRYIAERVVAERLVDATPILGDMRMIKSDDEIKLARHAGIVADEMMNAARETIANGVAEYEVALATSAAGTRKAAELLDAYYDDSDMSPNIHFLQIMASGHHLTKTHHRASTRVMKSGEPVFMCFCGMTNFHRFKLGFDRTFWIDDIVDKAQIGVYETALSSQQAALSVLRAGVTAESVHTAYAEVIQQAGYEYPFRCGRATGFSYLEKPQLVTNDKTLLQPGMVLAVDGSVAVDSFRAQVGDSLLVTENGYELLTHHPKNLEDIVL